MHKYIAAVACEHRMLNSLAAVTRQITLVIQFAHDWHWPTCDTSLEPPNFETKYCYTTQSHTLSISDCMHLNNWEVPNGEIETGFWIRHIAGRSSSRYWRRATSRRSWCRRCSTRRSSSPTSRFWHTSSPGIRSHRRSCSSPSVSSIPFVWRWPCSSHLPSSLELRLRSLFAGLRYRHI